MIQLLALVTLLSLADHDPVILSGVRGALATNAVEGPRQIPPNHYRSNLSNPEPQAVAATPGPAPQSPFAGLIAEYLRQDANGHTPTNEEIAAMATLQPAPDPASIREAMPYLLKALDNADIPLHSFALNAIIGLQTQPPPAPELSPAQAAGTAPVPPTLPAAYKPEVAKVLAPYIPQIAAHLTSDDGLPNRLLVATLLGGFTPDPPAAVYTPLLAFLKRDDAPGPVGLAVVSDLLQIGPISDSTADELSRFLRRRDQTSDSRANLADLLGTSRNQSQALNKALLGYLDSDDNSLRARVILTLPQLDLAADVFADAKSRVEQLAANSNENPQVIAAAKSVAPCWTGTRMASGCPVYQ
jgi:hypothetical protein